MVVIEMHVHPGHDMALKIVLDVREFSGEIPHVMIVDERDRCDRLAIRFTAPFLTDQLITYKIAKRLGPRRILAPLDDLVKVVEQVMIKRNTEPDKLLHKLVTRKKFSWHENSPEAISCRDTPRSRTFVREEGTGRLLSRYGQIEHGPLPIDEQEHHVGRPERVCKALESREIGNRLAVELQNDIARL